MVSIADFPLPAGTTFARGQSPCEGRASRGIAGLNRANFRRALASIPLIMKENPERLDIHVGGLKKGPRGVVPPFLTRASFCAIA
jgi:hypothetical protein